MNLIDIDLIIVREDRQRQVFNEKALLDLRTTMEKFLLHPPTIKSMEEPVLIAGERRLRVARMLRDEGIPLTFMGQQLPIGKIPVLPFNQQDAILIYEAELVENIHRDDLTWQERAMAMAKFHDMRTQQAAERGEVHTIADTTKEILKLDDSEKPTVQARTTTANAIHLGKAIENDYELASAKTESDALKIIKKREKAAERKQLAASVSLIGLKHDLQLGDTFELVKAIPDGSIDVVVTDPPYGADMDKKGTWSIDNHEYDDSGAFVRRMLEEIPDQLYRVMKDNSHAYIFCDWRYFTDWQVALALAGFRVWQRPIIWYKGSMGAFVDAKHGPRYTHEYIVYAMKGDREIDVIYDDVISVQQSAHHDHPAGKPPALFEFLLKKSGLPGEKCLDLFAGGGTIFEAAHNAKMSAIGFELNPTFHEMCIERITKLGGK